MNLSRGSNGADLWATPADSTSGRPDCKLSDGSRVAVIGGGPAGSLFSYYLLSLAETAGLELQLDLYEPQDFLSPTPTAWTSSGRDRFHRSHTSPIRAPRRCISVPHAPSVHSGGRSRTASGVTAPSAVAAANRYVPGRRESKRNRPSGSMKRRRCSPGPPTRHHDTENAVTGFPPPDRWTRPSTRQTAVSCSSGSFVNLSTMSLAPAVTT